MGDIYDSHEQGERVKSWLRENGGAILMGLVLAFGGLFGFKQWQVWQAGKVQQASAEYETLVELVTAGQLDAEMETGSWLSMPATSEHVFSSNTSLWQSLTREIALADVYEGIDPKARPIDPNMN